MANRHCIMAYRHALTVMSSLGSADARRGKHFLHNPPHSPAANERTRCGPRTGRREPAAVTCRRDLPSGPARSEQCSGSARYQDATYDSEALGMSTKTPPPLVQPWSGPAAPRWRSDQSSLPAGRLQCMELGPMNDDGRTGR